MEQCLPLYLGVVANGLPLTKVANFTGTRLLAKWVECLPMVQEIAVETQVESRLKKWYLMLPFLKLSIIRQGSRVKWSNPWNGVVPSPTPRCSSWYKGSLWITNFKIILLRMTLAICVNHIDIGNNFIPKLQFYLEKIFLPKRKINQLFLISKADTNVLGFLSWKWLRYLQHKITLNFFRSAAYMMINHLSCGLLLKKGCPCLA